MFKAGLVVLSLMSISFDGVAAELYKCQVTAVAKKQSKFEINEWTQRTFLAKKRFVTVDFHGNIRTKLELTVESDGSISGFVNKQYGFILRGSVTGAEFESAYAKGRITCAPAQDYQVAYMFLPLNEISVLGDAHTIFPLHNGPSLQNSCYIGDTNIALKQVRMALNVTENQSGIGSDQSIFVTVDERKCLEGVGYIGDYECTKWDIVRPVTYSLRHCDGEGDR